jgi:type IV secretory pathway TrbD component
VLLGAAAGYVVLGANDPGLLIGSFVGVVVVILATAVLRWFARRRST